MSRVTAATRTRVRYRPKSPRVLTRRDGQTPRKRRVRPGTGPLEHRHQPPPGAYARLCSWRTRRRYLQLVRVLLGHPRTWEALRRWHVDADTFVRWITTESRYADPRNGRDIRVRPDTVARRAELCERHVQRCRAIARELGVLVDVLPGRRLTLAEAAEARELDNGHQTGFSTVSALVVPSWLPSLGIVSPLPKVGPQEASQVSVICGEGGPSGVAQRGDAEPASPARGSNKRRPPPKRSNRTQTAADRAALGLARACVERIGWLHGESPWRILPRLRRFAAAGWTDEDLVDAVDELQRRNNRSTPTRDRVRTPWALFGSQIDQLDPQADHPHPDAIGLREAAQPWCGHCDPRTRLRGLDRVQRCPECHPARVGG